MTAIARDADWSGRTVAITGASGFVGRWLCRRLVSDGARVVALVAPSADARPFDEPSVRAVTGSIDDPVAVKTLIAGSGADTVLHLAAVNVNTGASVSPADVFETNLRGTWNVLEACRLSPAVSRVLVTSSREAEHTDRRGPGTAPRRRHPYQVSKRSAEMVAECYADVYGVPVAISRCDNIYGGGDLNWNRLIPGVVRSVLHGEPPVLRSTGQLGRDFVHVDDVVDGYLRLAWRAGDAGVRGNTFHFATGQATTVIDVVRQIADLAGRPDLRPVVPSSADDERVDETRDTTLERTRLGWSSRVSLPDGLRSTLDWYRAYFAGLPAAAR